MDLKKLQALADQDMIANVLKDWREKSTSEELAAVTQAFCRLFFYINSMELDSYSFKRIESEFRSAKNRAVLRARKAEELNKQMSEQIDDLKKKLSIFGGL
jgi:hypothetical protein